MIKKILRIDEFRVFQRWTPAADAVDFARVNLLYGDNGSGKSTLASLLAGASSDREWASGLRLTVEETDGTVSTVSAADHKLWSSLRVFNREFVYANVRFDTDGDSNTEPLLIIGKEQIDKKARLDAIVARLVEVGEKLPAQQKASKRAQESADALAKATADILVQELGALGGRYAPRNYNARELKKSLVQPARLVDDTQVSVDLEFIQAPQLNQLPALPRLEFNTAQLEADVAALLARRALSQPIPELRDDLDVAQWVQHGLTVHTGQTTCRFCGSELSPDRIAALERHFDKSLRQLQSDIKSADDNLSLTASQVEAAAAALPGANQVIASIREDWVSELEQAATSQGLFIERLASLRTQLAIKSASLFSPVTLDDHLPGNGRLDLGKLNVMLEKHNGFCADTDSLKLSAAKRIEAARVEAVRADHEALLLSAQESASDAAELLREQNLLLQEQRILAQAEMSAAPLADSLNADLARLLGRSDLSFQLADKGYSIRRGGLPALYLSEGEKTAVSLLYFLKSLEAHDCDIKNTIVVIDDPVSSLDNNVVAGVSAHLWARLVSGKTHCKQLFLLTHSFELFRTWINLIDRGAKYVPDLTSTTQELRIRLIEQKDGSVSRVPAIYSWPTGQKERNRMRSEYHYLFWRVAKTLEDCQTDPTLDKDLDAAAILPNACRRMLEAFLSFKCPGKIGDFRGQVEEAIGAMDESVTRTRIVTYLNTHSHNEEGDIGRPVPRPESISILAAVLDLVRYVDQSHYNSMCASLHLEPRTLTI